MVPPAFTEKFQSHWAVTDASVSLTVLRPLQEKPARLSCRIGCPGWFLYLNDYTILKPPAIVSVRYNAITENLGKLWMVMDELELIQSAKKGDLEAFNRLVLAFQNQAFNVALRILADEHLAEDATQDAFLSAYRNISGFRGGSFRAWILRIVTNRCYDELRRQVRQPTQPMDPFNRSDENEVDDPVVLKDENHLPETEAETRELESAIQKCIEGLSGDFRTVVVLVDVQGLDYQEACQIIQKPLGTLKSRLARARLSLQDCLQGVWELLPADYRLKDKGSHA